MGVSANLRCLTDIVQKLEDGGVSVAGVETETEETGLSGDLTFDVEFLPVGISAEDVSIEVETAKIDDDGRLTLNVSFHVDGVDSSLGEAATPAYKDPERLREVYEAYDTFPAMKEALGVDVTPKTVRNHMVNHGIHDPDSEKANATTATADDGDRDESVETQRDGGIKPEVQDGEAGADDVDAAPGPDQATTEGTGGSGESDAETVLSDGLGLPEDITLEEVKESVRSAGTMTEFRRSLDLQHEEARLVLENLNLINLIYGRVARGPNSDVSMEAVETRIRSAVGNTA